MDRATGARQAKANLTVAKARVANCQHWRSKGIAITVGSGVTRKRIVSRWQKCNGKSDKSKGASSLEEAELSGLEDSSVGGFDCCSKGHQHDDWKEDNCRKVTFTLDSGAAVSAAPKSLGDDNPMQIEQRARQPRENPCKTKDFECYRL